MTHGIKTWTFEFHVIPGRGVPDYEDQQLVQQTFDRNLRRLVELEGYGFEGVFFSEHHFLNSLSPVPNLLIAALAKMTTRFRLGVMGNVLPFHQPWRLAEELATLDFLGLATEHKHVSFRGDFYDFEDIPSMHRPRSEARRRHWMTIYSPETAA